MADQSLSNLRSKDQRRNNKQAKQPENRGNRSLGNTPANKARKAETRAHHLHKASERHHSQDYTTPVAEFTKDGSVKVRAGTVIRRGTNRHREILLKREEQLKRISKKRLTRFRKRGDKFAIANDHLRA